MLDSRPFKVIISRFIHEEVKHCSHRRESFVWENMRTVVSGGAFSRSTPYRASLVAAYRPGQLPEAPGVSRLHPRLTLAREVL